MIGPYRKFRIMTGPEESIKNSPEPGGNIITSTENVLGIE